MRIERPRTPLQVRVDGKATYRLGFAQMQMLRLIDALGRTEAPPREVNGIKLLTPTGMLREVVARDLYPLGFVDMARPVEGVVDYYLTALGRKVLKHGVVDKAPADKAKRQELAMVDRAISMLARQRLRAGAHRTAVHQGSRRSAVG